VGEGGDIEREREREGERERERGREAPAAQTVVAGVTRGTSLIRNSHPP